MAGHRHTSTSRSWLAGLGTLIIFLMLYISFQVNFAVDDNVPTGGPPAQRKPRLAETPRTAHTLAVPSAAAPPARPDTAAPVERQEQRPAAAPLPERQSATAPQRPWSAPLAAATTCAPVPPEQQVPRSCRAPEPAADTPSAGPYLAVNVAEIRTTASVVVKWGLSNATSFDMVSVFSPEHIIAAKRIDPGDVKRGHGQVSFELLNLRTQYTVKYIQFKEVLLQSEPICGELNTPVYPHLAVTSEPSTLVLMFISGRNVTPMVQYGTARDDLQQCVAGTSATYSMEDMQGCKRGGHRIKSYARAHFVHPGYIHTVRLRGLTSGARYWYRYGSPALADGWSAVHSFAAPARERRPFSFVAFGDLGTATWPDMRRFPEYWDCPAAQATADRLAAQLQEDRAPPFDFVLHLGDISYAVGFAPRWEQFHHLVAPVASHVPYLVVDGNHDVGDDSFGECGVPFFARFHFPNHPQPYYSYDHSYLHVVAVSTEEDPVWEPSTESYKWLEQDLAAVNRTATPWVVIAGHRTMYTSDVHWTRVKESWKMQAALEPLMKKYGVSLYMGGHVHNYERTCFVRHKQCVDDGVVAVQIGTAGQRTHPRDFSTEQPAWSVRRHAHNGYGVFDVTEDRLEFRFIRSSDGKEQDRFALTRANGVTQYANMWTQDVTDDEMIKKLNRKGFG